LWFGGRFADTETTSAARHRSARSRGGDAVAHDAVALPIVARLVDQLHKGAGRISDVDDDLDGEVAVVSMKRSLRELPDLQPRTHVWRSLVEKAGYKMADVPKNWDVFYDFFKGVQKALREQGVRHVYGLGFQLTTNGGIATPSLINS
jgi:hypothetical protein